MKKDFRKKDKKIVHFVKVLNRQVRNDVFGERFYLRQIAKGADVTRDNRYYDYEFVDNEDPKRNFKHRYWLSKHGTEISYAFLCHQVAFDYNNFIIKSDFWEKYYNNSNERSII